MVLLPFLAGEGVEGGLWVAVVIGFGRIWLIARSAVHTLIDLASIGGLVAALCDSLAGRALRNFERTENALTTVFYFLAGGVVFFSLFIHWRPLAAGQKWSP